MLKRYNINMNVEGRPKRTPEEIDVIFRKIEPYLKAGLSLNKACQRAEISKSVAYQLYEDDASFAEKIDTAKNHLSALLSDMFYVLLAQIAERIKNKEKLEKDEVDFMKWFATNSKSTKEEFGERKELEVIDPQKEIQRLMAIIEEDEKKVPEDKLAVLQES